MKAKGNQPYHSREVDVFYSASQIAGRRPNLQSAARNPKPYGPMTRAGYSSKNPSRMRNGKPGA